MSSWILLAAIGAVAAVDSAALFQGMLHQPLVACTLVGAALGLPVEGAFFGALLQLLWLNKLPVGTATYPDSGPASVGAAGGALIAVNSGMADLGLAGVAVLLTAIPLAQAGGYLTIRQRELQGGFLTRAIEAIEEGRFNRIRLYLLEGITLSATRGIVVALVSAGVAMLLLLLLGNLPLDGRIPPYTLLAGVFGVGLGATIELFDSREHLMWVAAGVIVGIVLVVMI